MPSIEKLSKGKTPAASEADVDEVVPGIGQPIKHPRDLAYFAQDAVLLETAYLH